MWCRFNTCRFKFYRRSCDKLVQYDELLEIKASQNLINLYQQCVVWRTLLLKDLFKYFRYIWKYILPLQFFFLVSWFLCFYMMWISWFTTPSHNIEGQIVGLKELSVSFRCSMKSTKMTLKYLCKYSPMIFSDGSVLCHKIQFKSEVSRFSSAALKSMCSLSDVQRWRKCCLKTLLLCVRFYKNVTI